jgi:predicted TIM-barrel fold metal-dependent hydrolase
MEFATPDVSMTRLRKSASTAAIAFATASAWSGLSGVSWHHRFQGGTLDDPFMHRAMERMAELGLVPAIHTGPSSSSESLWRLHRLASDFPGVTILAMDAFQTYEHTLNALHVAERTDNILWDLSHVKDWRRFGVWITRHGSLKLCFGGTLPYLGGSTEIADRLLDDIRTSDMNPEDRDNVLSANLARLLERS